MSSRTTLALLFLVGVLTGLAVQTGSLRSIDTVRRLQWTRSLWTGAPEVTEPWPVFGVRDDAGGVHAWWGAGQSLLFVPSDMLSAAIVRVAHVPPAYAARAQRAVVSATFYPLVTGLCLMAAFWWLSALGLSAPHATLGSLGLLFGTTLLYWTHGGQENSLMLLCTLVSSAGAAHWSRTGQQKSAAVAMAALGFTMLIRPQTFGMAGIGVAASLIALREHWRDAPRPVITRALVIAASVILGCVLCERVIHYARFHEVWGTYLGRITTYTAAHPELPLNWPLNTPFVDGFLGQVAWRGSIFLFEPLSFLLLLVCVCSRKSAPPAIVSIAAGLFLMLLVGIVAHAKFVYWYGGNTWGPRYITVPAEMCGALAVGLVASLWHRWSRVAKLAAGLVIAMAVAVQLSSVIFDDSLELVQAQPDMPVVLQRFANIWAFFTTHDVRTLNWVDYPTGTPHVTLFPWSAELFLGSGYGQLALGLWLVLVASVVVLILKLVRSSPTHERG